MNGNKLKQALATLGISLKEFAALMDVTPKTVSFWVNNHAPVPRPIALYLDLRLSNLAIAEQLAGCRA